jgi:hypothetical protein
LPQAIHDAFELLLNSGANLVHGNPPSRSDSRWLRGDSHLLPAPEVLGDILRPAIVRRTQRRARNRGTESIFQRRSVGAVERTSIRRIVTALLDLSSRPTRALDQARGAELVGRRGREG